MITLRDELPCEALRLDQLLAYGTSESVRKAWDTRGRGKKGVAKGKSRPLRRTEAARKSLLRDYERLGKQVEKMAKKLEDSREVQSIGGKCLHFLKNLGDWVTSYGGLRDLVASATVAVWAVVRAVAPHAAAIHGAIQWALFHVTPAVNHVAQMSILH